MKKPKNLLFTDFSPHTFEKTLQDILFIYEQEETLKAHGNFVNKIKEKFPGSSFAFCNIFQSSKLYGKYDLIIPIEAYDISGTVRPKLERFALRTKMRYFVIYEDTYGYVRLANKYNLLYRLYIQKPIFILYVLWGLIFIVIPCYVFSFYLTIKDFFRDIFRINQHDSPKDAL